MKNKNCKGLFIVVLILAVLMIMPGCAASKKNPYMAQRRKSNSHISTSQLGRNKYFFSTQYQKKLYKYKRK